MGLLSGDKPRDANPAQVSSKPSAPTTPKAWLMKVTDRCDKSLCDAQAFVRLTFRSGELDFCKHHANRLEASYAPYVRAVLDESDRINPRPSPSA